MLHSVTNFAVSSTKFCQCTFDESDILEGLIFNAKSVIKREQTLLAVSAERCIQHLRCT